MSSLSVHLFIDNSNIFISAKDEAETREGRGARRSVRLQFENLLHLALAGRQLGKAFVVGSIPPEQKAVWDRFERATGVKPELFERGEFGGKEQGLDQCLQVHMLRTLTDCAESPQVAVLMTGDGAGYLDGVGFHADMERMHSAGWGIEVLSWKGHCKKALRQWATDNGVFVALDDYYESITFIEGGRIVRAVDLSSRSVATPRKSPAQRAEERAAAKSAAQIALLERELREVREAQALKRKKTDRYNRRFQRGKK